MKKYTIVFFIFALLGCNNQQEQGSRYTKDQIAALRIDSTKILNPKTDSTKVIDLNPFLKERPFQFDTLVKEMKLIPLETTDESLLDVIRKVVITSSHIYIQDDLKDGGIVIFNKKGKFIKRIPNGRGPGELSRLYDIDFDKENNELVAYQHSFLLFFTPTGEYLRQKRLPLNFHNFKTIPDGYVFKALDREGNEHLNLSENFTLFITDKNFKLKSAGLPYNFSSNINIVERTNVFNNHSVKLTQRFTDTIYHYMSHSNRLKAEYVLDYREKKSHQNSFSEVILNLKMQL